MEKSFERRLLEWALGDGAGISSKNIARATLGLPPEEYSGSDSKWFYPLDWGDFNRCLELVRAVPECMTGVDRLAQESEQWMAIRREWATLERLHAAKAGFSEFLRAITGRTDEAGIIDADLRPVSRGRKREKGRWVWFA